MNHIHHDNALAMLRTMPFTAEELTLIEAAAADLPWEQLSPMIHDLQFPAASEAAKNAAYALIGELDSKHRGIAGLCVLASAMFESAQRFRSWGIPENIIDHTMSVLQRFTAEYKKEFGVFGFDRGFWAWRQTCGTIFRLGALEYEYLTMTIRNSGLTGIPAATPILTIHIPSGTDLSREALDASYAMARAFYPAHPEVCLADGQPPQHIICHSWLLSPTLRTFLGQNSGIRRFAEDFELYDSEAESKGCYHFLFLAKDDTPAAELPENSSLQRAVKAHLMAGGGIGAGAGLLKR